ncbi:hypothetical protein [Aurantimonas marianensis]|uniref:Uncharacterized protein n=1 Tax=Aurantimonas marianensis TaxID=2920428 RepID=A0A9X2H6X7_9HYPH|nr:hypothetical protein [Aurantimonas marianensis]MCP3056805.1 hypothetical protein [Aurantimonas marianensis]
MVSHPCKLGFERGIIFQVSENLDITQRDSTAAARRTKDIVYVALLTSGNALKVGETGNTLSWRWNPMIQMIGSKSTRALKPNELRDQEKLRSACRGECVEVWFKRPSKLTIGNEQLPAIDFVSRYAEEALLCHLYHPLFGKHHSVRRDLGVSR